MKPNVISVVTRIVYHTLTVYIDDLPPPLSTDLLTYLLTYLYQLQLGREPFVTVRSTLQKPQPIIMFSDSVLYVSFLT